MNEYPLIGVYAESWWVRVPPQAGGDWLQPFVVDTMRGVKNKKGDK